jgi:type I restriction enzyme R subunit
MDNKQYNALFSFIWNIANDMLVRNGDRQVAQITFNDDIINIVAGMLEEKTEFVQTYFANQDFQNFVNARVFQAAVSRLSI